MTFAERLRYELKYQGLTHAELAEKSGMTKWAIDNYCNHRFQIPRADSAVALAKALGVSVEYLFTGDEIDIEKLGARGRQQILVDFELYLKERYPKLSEKRIKREIIEDSENNSHKVDIRKKYGLRS